MKTFSLCQIFLLFISPLLCSDPPPVSKMVQFENNTLWVFSLAEEGARGSSGGYPCDAKGTPLSPSVPVQTLAWSGQQRIALLSSNDFFTLKYNVLLSQSGLDSNRFSAGSPIDTFTFQIRPYLSAFQMEKGGITRFVDQETAVLSLIFTPNPSRIPPVSNYPNHRFPTGVSYRGVNLSGGEGSTFELPHYTNGIYFAYRGVNVIRIPFRWENIQPNPSIPIDFSIENGKTLVEWINNLSTAVPGMAIILDMHNSMRYRNYVIGGFDSPITQVHYANVWGALANQFKNHPNIFFDLMNAPDDVPTELILNNYNNAIFAIRSNGFKNLLLLQGNGGSRLSDWTKSDYGTPNSAIFIPGSIFDTEKNYAICVREEFDEKSNPLSRNDVDPRSERKKAFFAFTQYLQLYGLKGFVSEIKVSSEPDSLLELKSFLTALEESSYTAHLSWGFLGWDIWGSFEEGLNQMYSLVLNPDGTDRLSWASVYSEFFLKPAQVP